MKKFLNTSIAFLLLISLAFPVTVQATISSQATRIQYTGNDVATSFSFPYKFLQTSDLTVVFTNTAGSDATLVEDTDYTVTGAGDESGGSITYPVSGDPLATGEYLTIYRQVPYTQEADLSNQGAYFLETIEDTVDKLEMQIQQVKEITDRCPKLSISDFTGLPDIDDIVAAIETGIVTIDAYNNDLVAAAAAIGASKTTLVINTTANVTSDLTTPSTLALWVIQGGMFNPSSGKTLAIDGDLFAGHYQIFTGAGVAKPTNVKEMDPRWWGADGVTDDSAALQKAITAASGTDIPVMLFNGLRLEDGVTVASGSIIRGKSKEQTIIYLYDGPWGATDAAFGGTTLTGNEFSDFQIEGSNLTPATHPNLDGISLTDINNSIFRDLKITSVTGVALETRENTSGACQDNLLENLYLGEQQPSGGSAGKPLHLYSVWTAVDPIGPNQNTTIRNVKLRAGTKDTQLFIHNSTIDNLDVKNDFAFFTSIPITITNGGFNKITNSQFINNGHAECLEIGHYSEGTVIDNCLFSFNDSGTTGKAIAHVGNEGNCDLKITNSVFKTDSGLYSFGTVGSCTSKSLTFTGNRVVRTGTGATNDLWEVISSSPVNSMFSNNHIETSGTTDSVNLIKIGSGTNNVVTGNQLIGNDLGSGILINAGTGNIVSNNQIKDMIKGVFFQSSGSLDNDIRGNTFDSCVTNIDESATSANRRNKIRDNSGFITEASGTFTLPNGQTTVDVTHGVARTPVAGEVIIAPLETLGSASEYWTGTLTDTSFRATVDTDPGANVDFMWRINASGN